MGKMATHLRLSCPHCGAEQNIFASDVPAGTTVTCSRCHEPIGRWASLIEATEEAA